MKLIVITDLDGTLLDHDSYSYEASLPAVRKLLALKIPLVLCSSKTRHEMVPLWRELGLGDPFISENGGAIYLSPGYFSFPVPHAKSRDGLEVVELGSDVASLRRALDEASRQAGVTVRSFGLMSANEVAQVTGLAPEQAALAIAREYDEAFFVTRGRTDALLAALRARGLAVTSGGRFLHVTGGHDKGRAVKLLLDYFRKMDSDYTSVGLGNSANDLPLLSQVDRPVLIKNPDQSHDAEVLRAMPQIERSREIGPAGWRAAIETILANRTSEVP